MSYVRAQTGSAKDQRMDIFGKGRALDLFRTKNAGFLAAG